MKLEYDLEARLWTVPAARMKKGREHRVPLSSRAVELLQEAMRYADTSGLVFPSCTGRQIAGAILSRTMKERGLATVHGFRSSFADWAAECTDADRETIERALAHVNGNATEAAYRRAYSLKRPGGYCGFHRVLRGPLRRSDAAAYVRLRQEPCARPDAR